MKKIILILLAFTLAFSAMPGSTATIKEANDDSSAEETGLMTTLGFLTDDDMFSYNKDFEISRAAFVKIANRIAKAEGMGTGTAPFWDVNAGSEYYSDIDDAYAAGLIDGGIGDSFRPYDIITYNEAIKITGVMLGYKAYALISGGYPVGFADVSRSAGFGLGGIGGGKGITYRQAVKILFKALTASMLEQTKFGDDISYSTDNKLTILKQNFDVELECGTVNATDVSALTYGGKCSTNRIVVGDTTFRCDNPEKYRDLLGYRVNCYYNSESDYNDIVFVAKYRNKVAAVDSEEITGVSAGSIEYTDEETDKDKSIDLDSSVTYIYNGKVLDYATQYSKELITDISEGKVEFIDNNDDDNYDVVSIKSYENYFVDAVNKDEETIYGKYNNGDSLVLDDNVKWQISDNYGKSYTLSDISAGVSLMAARSLDKLYADILYSDDITEGRAAAVEDGDTVTINGKEYKVSTEYLKEGTGILPGSEGVFYLNAYGNIANFETASLGGGKFGLLMKVKSESELSDALGISVMSSDEDKSLTFKLEKPVEIDGISYKEAEKIKKTLNPDNKEAVVTVIRYWTNDNGNVYKIDTPTVSNRESADNTLVKRWDMTNAALGWKNSGRIGSKFYLNTSSGTLYGLDDTVESADDVTVYTPSTLSDDASCAADIYSVGTDTVKVNVLVMKKADIEGSGGGAEIPNTSYFCVFEKYTHELDSDGEPVGVITYYDGQSKTTALVDVADEDKIPDLAKLKCGDAFYIKTDKKGYLNVHLNQDKGYTNLYRIYDYENDEFLYDSKYNDGHWALSTGVVYELEDTYARVGAKGLDYNNMTYAQKDEQLTTYLIYYAYNGGGVYEVTSGGKLKVSVPSADTVRDYSSAGNGADRLIAQREYGHDRRNCYFRHKK